MSSKAGLRHADREESKQEVKRLRHSTIGEIGLLKSNPEKYMLIQIEKWLRIGDSGKLMAKEKFKEVLKAYIEKDEIPAVD
jgi:hypothetical protein